MDVDIYRCKDNLVLLLCTFHVFDATVIVVVFSCSALTIFVTGFNSVLQFCIRSVNMHLNFIKGAMCGLFKILPFKNCVCFSLSLFLVNALYLMSKSMSYIFV